MRLSSKAIVAIALAYHLAGVLFTALMLPFPNGFDEIQHLSYARSMQAAPRLLPEYPVGGTLDDSATRWTEVPNYLNHPSPYYIAMGLVDAASHHNLLVLRLVNAGLSALGMALALIAGMRLLQGALARATFAAVLVSFPKLAIIGGIINNDNAALVASGLTFLALAQWARARESAVSQCMIGAAFVLAGWTKFTVLVAAVLAFSAYEAIGAWRGQRSLRREGFGCLAVPMGGLALAAIPYVDSLVRYGRLVWHPSNFYLPPEQRLALDLVGYLHHFFNEIRQGWAAIQPAPLFLQLGFFLLLILYVAGVIGTAGGASRQRRVCTAYGAATVLMIVIHVAFGWAAFKEEGYLWAAQIRYYYAVWPGVALAIANGQAAMEAGPIRSALAITCAMLVVPASMQFVMLVKSALTVLPLT